MTHEAKLADSSIKFLVYFVLLIVLVEGIPMQEGNGQAVTSDLAVSTEYNITFTATGLPAGTSWTVRIIINSSTNVSDTSNSNLIEFRETNGSYNYVALSTTSYITPPSLRSY